MQAMAGKQHSTPTQRREILPSPSSQACSQSGLDVSASRAPFVALFPPSEQSLIREVFRSGLSVKATPTGPQEMNGQRLVTTKRLRQVIALFQSEAIEFAAAILEEGRRAA